jgi:hypothetical protein
VPIIVARTLDGPKCYCRTDLGLPELGDYERVPPPSLTRQTEILTEEEYEDLNLLADFIADSDICSFDLPKFIEVRAEDPAVGVTEATEDFGRRVRGMNARGYHCSPARMAEALRAYAGRDPQ